MLEDRKLLILVTWCTRLSRILQGDKESYYQMGGKAILVKHVLQSQSIYLLAAFEPPKVVLKKVEIYMVLGYI